MHPILRTLRDTYRLFTGKPRSLPVRAVGTIEARSTADEPASWFSGEYTNVRKYRIKFSFEVDGWRVDTWREVSDHWHLREGDKIAVYYVLGDKPPRIWVDKRPRSLSDQQVSNLEREVLGIRGSGWRAVGKVSRVEAQRLLLAPQRSGQPISSRADVYCVTYEFNDDQGKRWTGARWMREKGEVEVGSEVYVGYLPDHPERNTIVT